MITGVILTHNEEQNIVACIEHLRPHVAEIILVDTESTDRTVEVSRPLVDRVLTHPHVPNFDSARNIAIPEARYDWLWFVDADEHIPELTGELVNRWIRERGDEFEAINIPFKSYFCGRWMRHCGWWPGYTCPRVLKRGHFKFSQTLHGGVKLAGREVLAPADEKIGIEHYSFRDLHHWIEKCNRYTSTEALQLAERGVKYDWRGALRFMVHDLWEHYEQHNARMDGERGWILTWCAALYRWMSVAKLIDHGCSSEQSGGPSNVPADLDEFVSALEQELAFFRAEQPSLPLGIVWRAPIEDDSPFSIESRHCIQVLAGSGRALTVEALPSRHTAQLSKPERVLLGALQRTRRGRCVATITQWSNVVVPADPFACHNVLRLPVGSIVPPELVPHVDSYDELWVESPQELRVLREQGAAAERMRVVPPLVSASQDQSLGENDPAAGRLEQLIQSIESRFHQDSTPAAEAHQVRVTLEGEFFAGHSFSNINERIALSLRQQPTIALSLQRVRHQPGQDRRAIYRHELEPYFNRAMPPGPDVTIRHAFPANWNQPRHGKWVHIQPWEFGHLPNDWVHHLRHEVDEIWVMSQYVRQVYLNSGVAPEKLQYIPWGIDVQVFQPSVPARRLPTEKTFRFLYVGGTILRKGFDRVLAAYLAEFRPEDDVCLVIKDAGASTFYQPQSMRTAILAAREFSGNPAILYFEQDWTPSQLASLYASCHCLVAPYRGEGFGLPVLEALACGVPPIIPRNGPTDDFVDADSGYLLPSRFVPAEGVTNLCGPATELAVTLEDLRAAMRQAYSDRQKTGQLGLAGSRRVRREFTWDRTVRDMSARLRILSGRCEPPRHVIDVTSHPNEQGSAAVRLAVLVADADDPRPLVDTLARVRPFVDVAAVHAKGTDARVPQIAKEYSAAVVEHDQEHVGDADWQLRLRPGEYLADDDFSKLRTWLQELPEDVHEVALRRSPVVAGQFSHPTDQDEVRLIRLSSRLLTHDASDKQQPSERRVEAPFVLLHTQPRRSALSRSENWKGRPADTTMLPRVVESGVASPAQIKSPYGRLQKSLLIQMACGPHLDLLALTRDHHGRYAERHGLDYWCVSGNPTFGKRPGWGKVPLMLSGIALGYECIIWLDADAVLVRPEVNLTSLVPAGIGMVRHPQPEHWNTGVIVARASREVEEFWRQVDLAPENDSSWMEQAAVNALAALPAFSGLLEPLGLRFNSVPGFAAASDPVIVAAHGRPHAQRMEILRGALTQCQVQVDEPARKQSLLRQHFGSFLNELGLHGEAVEVGVARGEFSQQLLDQWHGRMLHLVDPWRHLPDYRDIANGSDNEHEANLDHTRRNLAPYVGRFRFHRALSAEAVGSFPDDALDFVYLDANHSYETVSQDLHLWFPKIKRGGVLAGHDFLDGELPEGRFGVASAVRAFAQDVGLNVQLTDDAAWPSWYFVKA
jgi:glycosyltransferase involved in cell wall biosynthesis